MSTRIEWAKQARSFKDNFVEDFKSWRSWVSIWGMVLIVSFGWTYLVSSWWTCAAFAVAVFIWLLARGIK